MKIDNSIYKNKNLSFSIWENAYDNAVQVIDSTIPEILDFLQESRTIQAKELNYLFNLNKFFINVEDDKPSVKDKDNNEVPRRCNLNVECLYGMNIDFDNGSVLNPKHTIAEISEKYKDYEFLIYTTASHLKSKGIEKFRMVIFFHSPLPIEKYLKIKEDVKSFFGYSKAEKLPKHLYFKDKSGNDVKIDKENIDQASFTVSQGFYLPADLADKRCQFVHNSGKLLDWTQFKEDSNFVNPLFNGSKNTYAYTYDNPNAADIVSWVLSSPMLHKDDGKKMRLWHSGEKTVGGWFMYKSNPDWVNHNSQPNMLLKDFASEYWGLSLPEFNVELSILDKKSEQSNVENKHYEHSDGQINTIRKKLKDEYLANEKQAQIVITNPGVGKTISLPEVHDNLVYARNSNASVRALAKDLRSQYPDKVIFELYSFKEIFKRRWPEYKIIENDNEMDIFSPPSASWFDTFAKMKPKDAIEADAALAEYRAANNELNLSEIDILCCTTTMLKKIWRRQKLNKETGEKWEHPFYNLDIQKLITKNDKFLKFLNNFFKSYYESEIKYETVNILPTNFVIVIDDITGSDGHKFQNFKSGDDVLLQRYLKNVELCNEKKLEEITELEKIKNVDWLYTNVSDYKKSTLEKDIYDFEVFDAFVHWKKLDKELVVNRNYRQIFTCAESVQVKQCELILNHKGIDYAITDLTELQPTTNVLIIPSSITLQRNDGLLYPILNYLRKKYKVNMEFIADGFGCEYNHSNTKGRNNLKEENIVFKVSKMHPDGKRAICLSTLPNYLKGTIKQRNLIELEKLKGDAEQVIGRNSGWRDTGKVSIGIVDIGIYNYLVENMFYDVKDFKSDEPWVNELIEILSSVETWLATRKYSVNSFIADCEIKKKNDVNTYKRLLRICTAVKNLEQTKKTSAIIEILNDKIIEITNFINLLLVKTSNKISLSDEYGLKILGNGKHNLSLLKSLGIVVKRLQRKEEYYFYLTNNDLNNLKALSVELLSKL